MAPRGLGPEKIVNLHDVVERRFSMIIAQVKASLADRAKEVVSRFETSSNDRDKDRIRKAFCRCLWSWSLLIQKRVI